MFANLSNFSEEGEDRSSKERRVCHAGAGVEETPGKRDTEDFILQEDPAVVNDASRGFKPRDTGCEDKNYCGQGLYTSFQGWDEGWPGVPVKQVPTGLFYL
jgi:hypothetical protein